MNLKIEIQKNIFLKTIITNHSRFKDPNIYFLPDFHLFFFFFTRFSIYQWIMYRILGTWHNSSTVTGAIVHQWLAQFFKSHWYDCSTVAGIIIQQSLVRLFNSHWHGSSTVAGTILQQSRA